MQAGDHSESSGHISIVLDDRYRRAVKQINNGHDYIVNKYRFCETGYTAISESKTYGSLWYRLGLIPSMFVTGALLWFWCFVLIPMFLIRWIFFCQFRNNCNIFDYIRKWIGDQRLYLLKYERKYDSVRIVSNWFSIKFIFYQIWNIVIGSAQLVEYLLLPYFGHRFYDNFVKYRALYYDSNAFPYLFSVVTKRRDEILSIVHKAAYNEPQSPARSKKLKAFQDRATKTFNMVEFSLYILCFYFF